MYAAEERDQKSLSYEEDYSGYDSLIDWWSKYYYSIGETRKAPGFSKYIKRCHDDRRINAHTFIYCNYQLSCYIRDIGNKLRGTAIVTFYPFFFFPSC